MHADFSRHPFEWVPKARLKHVFVLLVLITVVIMVSLLMLGVPLVTKAAPAGILSFEFAGNLSKAQSMITSWGPKGQVYAGLNLGLDYLFLVAYSTTISLGCVLASRYLAKQNAYLGSVGNMLAWGQLVAALLDGIENYALIKILLGTDLSLWPVVALWCAAPKFLIIVAGLAYFAIGIAVYVMTGRQGKEHAG